MSLRYIHGLETDTAAVEKLKDPTFQFQRTTHGEMRLSLLNRQLDILLAAHPDSRKAAVWRDDKQLIENVLYQGVHGLPSTFTGIFSSERNKVLKEIQAARKNFGTPSGFQLFDRKNLMSGISDDIIKYSDCGTVYDGNGFKPGVYYTTAQRQMICLRYMPILNGFLERAAHNLMYEFQADISETALVALKGLAHQGAVTEAAKVTEFQRQNIRLWVENGIMRFNAEKGIGAVGGVDSIAELRKARNLGIKITENGAYDGDNAAIGFLDPLTWAIIIKLATILVAAIGAVAGLISAIKGHDATAFATQSLKLLGGAEGAASPTDFKLPKTNDTGGGGGTIDPPSVNVSFDLQKFIKDNPLEAGAIGLVGGYGLGKVLKVW